MGDGPPQRMPVNMALKMLISPKEGACILGPNGSYSKQIADRTGVRLQLSQKGEFYPGTQMQELCIRGAANDMVLQGVMQVISRMSEDHRRIFGVETDVEEGGARVHFVVPVPSANAFKGIQGENMRYIQGESGMKIHVEDFVVGSGDMAEQVVSCAGPLRGLEVVVSFLLEKVAEVSSQPWFRDWAFSHKACPGGIPGQAPKGGAGHGLKGGKGPPGGCSGCSGCSLGGYGPAGYAKGGKDAGKMGGKGYASAPVTPAAGMQLLKGAPSALPSELANPMDQSQVVQYLCPANSVANAGNSLLEISGATATHIDVRDAENPAEKAITISGNAVGCCVAYLHVVSRFSGFQPGGREMMQPVQQMQQGFTAPAGAGMNCMAGIGNMCGMGGMMGCMGNTGNGGMCCMGGMDGAGNMGMMGTAGSIGNMGNTGNMGSMGNMGMVGSGSFL